MAGCFFVASDYAQNHELATLQGSLCPVHSNANCQSVGSINFGNSQGAGLASVGSVEAAKNTHGYRRRQPGAHRKAMTVEAHVIVLAGAFMAETAKPLNPSKTVLIPDTQAGCSLTSSIAAEDILRGGAAARHALRFNPERRATRPSGPASGSQQARRPPHRGHQSASRLLLLCGVIVPQGPTRLRQMLPSVLAERTDVLSPRVIRLVEELAQDWRRIDDRVDAVSGQSRTLARQDESFQRLMSVPGTGRMTASAMVATIGNGAAISHLASMATSTCECSALLSCVSRQTADRPSFLNSGRSQGNSEPASWPTRRSRPKTV